MHTQPRTAMRDNLPFSPFNLGAEILATSVVVFFFVQITRPSELKEDFTLQFFGLPIFCFAAAFVPVWVSGKFLFGVRRTLRSVLLTQLLGNVVFVFLDIFAKSPISKMIGHHYDISNFPSAYSSFLHLDGFFLFGSILWIGIRIIAVTFLLAVIASVSYIYLLAVAEIRSWKDS